MKTKKLVMPKKKKLVSKPVKKLKVVAEKISMECTSAGCLVPTDIVADDPMFIPQYKTEHAACADLVANLKENGKVLIQHRGVVMVDCGFSMAVPEGYKAEIVARSGFASKGLVVCNGPGQIDSDYRGRVKVILCNVGQVNPITINHGERFAQMYLTPVHKFSWKPASELPSTDRGEGGFGSTGKV